MYRLLRAAAFRLDPERAHRLALRTARAAHPLGRLRRRRGDPVDVFGLTFPNRVGLAAGYDKDAAAWRSLAGLGFGHIEVGTVTPLPQPGNSGDRITRIPERRALINRMGFPSQGAAAMASRLGGRRNTILGVSIGPNAATPPEGRIADYLALAGRFGPLADYLAINVSSPNTARLRDLEQGDALRGLLGEVVEHSKGTPMLVKLSPDLDDPAPVVAAIEDSGAHGIILGNTTVTRPEGIPDLPGGLSGAPLGDLALRTLQRVRRTTSLPLVACGGIMSANDARRRVDAGAELVQIYTGLVYTGPSLVGRMARALA